MRITNKGFGWTLWGVLTALLAGGLAWSLYQGDDKTVFMPGAMTDGHHQIGIACAACHRDPFGGPAAMQEACLKCHGHARNIKAIDSHPKSKFTDPRNADRVKRVNATLCLTCHREHRPEITRENGVTAPKDFCFHCHADIAEDRPSHRGMAFTSCADAGCHNFHDNRALYEDFLTKHLDEPAVSEKPLVPARDFASLLDQIPDYPLDRYPPTPLSAAQQDAPASLPARARTVKEWLTTAHARSGVNCSACHERRDPRTERRVWEEDPNHEACASCHQAEVEGFLRGKHGMRLAVGLAPMTPAEGRLPMKAKARDQALGCTSCHSAHAFDTRKAAAAACLGCHDDTHSRAYETSPHASLWKKELTGELPPGSGVSCATCHLPRMEHDASDFLRRILVQHNQNGSLRPNEKMIRPACLHCHGLGFSLDALADRTLAERNYRGHASVRVESLEMARREQQRPRRAEQAPANP